MNNETILINELSEDITFDDGVDNVTSSDLLISEKQLLLNKLSNKRNKNKPTKKKYRFKKKKK